MNSIDQIKQKKALERDLAKARELFGEQDYQVLSSEQQIKANRAFERYLTKSPADQTIKLNELKQIELSQLFKKSKATVAFRLHESESGLWLVSKDSILDQSIPALGISLYDCDNQKISTLHAAEYDWEIYLNV